MMNYESLLKEEMNSLNDLEKFIFALESAWPESLKSLANYLRDHRKWRAYCKWTKAL